MTRAAIITAIQRGLKRGPLPPEQQTMLATRTAAHPTHTIPTRGQRNLAERITLFTHYVEREFGTVTRLASPTDIPDAIISYLASQNVAPTITISPHPTLQAIPFNKTPLLATRFGTATPTDQVSLQHAFAGIAETGTLLLPSGPTRPTSNNLLPDNAIVVLNANDIVATYEDAFNRLRATAAPATPFMPRNIMLVTGPSRSADIEQTLELGAHGPRRLHILITDGPE